MNKLTSLMILLCGTTLLAACNGEATPETSAALLADNVPTTLVDNIVNGSSTAENRTQWLCELTNGAEQRDNYILSFWSDETGIAGNQSMSWFAFDDEQLVISWSLNQVILSDFIFEENASITAFSAISDKSDRLDCNLNGPEILSEGLQLDFEIQADAQIINNRFDQNDIWECAATDSNGTRTERTYAFWRGGMGTSDGSNITWFFNNDENIIVSYSDNVRELRSIRYASTGQENTNFTAFDRQHTLNCTK